MTKSLGSGYLSTEDLASIISFPSRLPRRATVTPLPGLSARELCIPQQVSRKPNSARSAVPPRAQPFPPRHSADNQRVKGFWAETERWSRGIDPSRDASEQISLTAA